MLTGSHSIRESLSPMTPVRINFTSTRFCFALILLRLLRLNSASLTRFLIKVGVVVLIPTQFSTVADWGHLHAVVDFHFHFIFHTFPQHISTSTDSFLPRPGLKLGLYSGVPDKMVMYRWCNLPLPPPPPL